MKRKALSFIFLIFASVFLILLLRHERNSYEKWYKKIDRAVSPQRIQKLGYELSASPHRAGTESNKKVGDLILHRLSEYGLKTAVEEYTFDFPEPQEAQLLLVSPVQIRFDLHEKKLPEDSWSAIAGNELPYLAFSTDGDLEGRLIYANAGSREDYAYLKSRGIQLSKTIALVRARGVCRSMKALAAEEEGLAGLLIYPELKDQGFRKPEFPYGPHLNPWVSQRGSLLKYFLHPGEPSNPEAQSFSTLPRIPALPVSQETASVLLSHIQGESVPESWQGWLPEGYRTGPGPATVRMIYRSRMERRTIRNIFAWLNPKTDEKQFVIAGNHYDAWVYGAADPISGTTVMLETVKVLSELSHEGWSPRRKILFAFWDGEEYGMFGSTAWVKKNLPLLKNTIAYINIDTAFRARDLAAYITPGLYTSMDNALIGLKDPDSGRYFSEIRPEFQNPGFSGDVAPFMRFAGIPVMEAGFGRSYSVYHSLYDDEMWLEKFGDPQARFRAALTQILSRYLFRLSNDNLIPYDFTEIQPYATQALNALGKQKKDKEWASETEPLRKEMDLFHTTALRIRQKINMRNDLPLDSYLAVNKLLMLAMQAFYNPDGSGKSVLMESSAALGCAGEALSETTNAFGSNDKERIRKAIKHLTSAFSKSRGFLERISFFVESS